MRGRENEKRASEFERQGQKKLKKISKKPLDKQKPKCYNKIIKGNESQIKNLRVAT